MERKPLLLMFASARVPVYRARGFAPCDADKMSAFTRTCHVRFCQCAAVMCTLPLVAGEAWRLPYVISDLLCYIVLYFSSLYIVFYLTLGACLNWRFTAQIQTWPSYQRHRRCTVIQQPPPRPCQAAVLLLTP